MSTFKQALHSLIPQWAYARLIGDWDEQGVQKYTVNTWWLLVRRLTLYPISFVVVASVSRYLGPEGIGKLSYAQSIVGIIATIAVLGVDQILVRDLVRYPHQRNEILGTAFKTHLATSCIAFIATVSVFVLLQDDHELNWIMFFMALSLITGPFALGNNLFAAQALSKYPTISAVGSGLVIAFLKLLFVLLKVPLVYFAVLFLIESLLVAILTVYFYRHAFGGHITEWTFSFPLLKRFLNDSWPLLISATSVYLLARIDQIMLGHYVNISEVGLYGAVVQLTDIWIMIPTLLIGSLYPAVAGMYNRNHAEYRRRMILLTGLTLFIAISFGMFIIALAPIIIHVIYGKLFSSATPILQLYTLYAPIAVLYAIIQNHLTTANRTRIMLLIGLTGAGINIGLNMVLIPSHGALGATIATIIASLVMVLIPFALLMPWRHMK